MTISRRDLGKLGLLSLPLVRTLADANSVSNGVQLGMCSFSFRGLGLDELIRQMKAISIGQLELESSFVEPASTQPVGGGRSAAPAATGTATPAAPGGGRGQTPEQREALRNWRLTVPLDDIRAIRRRLDDAGIDVYAYNVPVNDTVTEPELDRIFRIARVLGAQVLNSPTTLPVVPRLAGMAELYNMRVGLHPSGGTGNPDGIGSGESYRKAIAISPRIGINPDLNGWRGWGPDPLAFIREIGPRITTMHFHDSNAPENRSQPAIFGAGQNPIRDILRVMREEKLTFVAMIERGGAVAGPGNVTELRKCLDFCRTVLRG